jgi:MFS superfamily sulfate permease-like transporter
LIVRPENGLFFANAAAFHDAIFTELSASSEPVTAVLLDLGATTDLDVPSADMLAELGEELHNRNVRLMLTRVIAPVRQMLEQAGAMQKIKPEDIFIDPTEAVLDHLSKHYDEASIQELLSSGAKSVHDLLQASLATAPAEHKAALIGIANSVGQGIKPGEKDRR